MRDYYSPNEAEFMGETDSQSIQNAVNAAAKGEVHIVRIPRRNARTGEDVWMIDRTILLPSDITIELYDCHLTLAEGVYQNVFRNENMYTDLGLTLEGEQHDIRIVGFGNAVLDGGLGNDLREANSGQDGRPNIRYNNFILLHNVRDYVLENFKCQNMRWWAINQIFCRNGRLSNLSFFNGEIIPNQDGINLRLGCENIIIENITGRTGDDTVAITLLRGGDYALSVEGKDVDTHDISIRNVFSNTRQTIVALRASDGMKLYRVDIDNVRDIGGGYESWGVVRIGENNWYRERPNILGEMYEINVRNVYSRYKGTVFLNASLKDSRIENVYAGGSSMHAVSTFMCEHINRENNRHVQGGVDMENVVIENIHYNGTAGYCDWATLTVPGEPFNGCALDFRCMREGDGFQNVVFRDIFACEGAELVMSCEGLSVDIQ